MCTSRVQRHAVRMRRPPHHSPLSAELGEVRDNVFFMKDLSNENGEDAWAPGPICRPIAPRARWRPPARRRCSAPARGGMAQLSAPTAAIGCAHVPRSSLPAILQALMHAWT